MTASILKLTKLKPALHITAQFILFL